MKKRKYLLAIVLVTTLILLSACSSNSNTNTNKNDAATNANGGNAGNGGAATTDTPDDSAAPDGSELPRDPITLKVFIGGTDDNKGVWNTSIAKEIQKKFGITLDFITGDDVKEKTLIAGGDLPDVITTGGSVSALVDSLIQGGQVIPLDDLIAKYGSNITKNTPQALDIMKATASNNTGKVYFLPVRVNKAASTPTPLLTALAGFYTRWDLYKAIGAPAMSNEDDFLKVNKEMQDKFPKTKDGKKTYAFSAWAADPFPYIISYPFSMGYNNWTADTSISATTGEVVDNYIDKDGVFWNGIKFFNKAYRMGLFDPEGFTQKIDQYIAKLNNGQVFNSAASFWTGGNDLIANTGNDNAELQQLPGPFPGYMALYAKDAPGGNLLGPARAITKANKYPERTMELFNYLSGDEGGRLLFTGVKGVDWDVVDGKPQLIGKMANPSDAGYNDYVKSVGVTTLNKLSNLHEAWTAEDGYPLDLKLVINPATITKAEKELAQQNGAELYPGQVYDKLVKDGKAVTDSKYFAFTAFVKQMSEPNQQVMVKADQYFLANVAKYIMAKDDAAFDAAKNKAVDDFIAMGVDKAYAEFHQLIDDAKKFAKDNNLE